MLIWSLLNFSHIFGVFLPHIKDGIPDGRILGGMFFWEYIALFALLWQTLLDGASSSQYPDGVFKYTCMSFFKKNFRAIKTSKKCEMLSHGIKSSEIPQICTLLWACMSIVKNRIETWYFKRTFKKKFYG